MHIFYLYDFIHDIDYDTYQHHSVHMVVFIFSSILLFIAI